jgi:hypothetical protein
MFSSAGCSPLRAEGFSCSLAILYEGLEIRKLQFLFKNIYKIFSAVKCLNFLVIKNQNPGSGTGSAIRKNAESGSGSTLNQCGSETLILRMPLCLVFSFWKTFEFLLGFWLFQVVSAHICLKEDPRSIIRFPQLWGMTLR